VVQDRRHQSLLQFIRKIADTVAGYSKDDLVLFRSVASREFPSLVALIDDYIRLAERSDTDVLTPGKAKSPKRTPKESAQQMHLFDLLRDKRLFASNNDLAGFATRILPNIKSNRFDKMSRGDIAARIIEHLESKDRRTREELEASMREAVSSPVVKPADRKTFLSKWENIIKGIPL